MKIYAIQRNYGFIETTADKADQDTLQEQLSQMNDELRQVYEKYGFHSLGNDTRFIPAQKMSAMQCEKCGNLMINRDKNPTRFDNDELWNDLQDSSNMIVYDGGSLDGKNVCMACLPTSHRWGFFS